MKIVSYNIFEGAKAGIEKVIAVVRELDPDILALQEANSFAADEKKLLFDVANQLGLPPKF